MDFRLNKVYPPSGDQPQAIKKLVAGLKKGYRFQTLLGVTGSGKTYTIANVINEIQKPTLVIAPNKTLAAQLYREYKTFFPYNSVNYFVSYYDYYQPEAYLPITDTYIEKEARINEEIDKLRHKATAALLTRKDVIIVASVSCIYNLGLPKNYLKAALTLSLNQIITRNDLIQQLVKIQFERTNNVLNKGFFRIRGDVFEIVPAFGEVIYQIELKDQKIFEIRVLDFLTKKLKEKLEKITIFPAKHFVSNEPEIKEALKNIKLELEDRLKFFKSKKLFLEAERLKRRTLYDIEMIKSLGYCHGIENYSRHLLGKMAGEPPDSLLSYFPVKNNKPDFLTIIDESHISIPQLKGMFEGDKSRKLTLVEYGWRLPSALDNRPLKFEEFLERVDQVIFTSATPGDFEKKNSQQIVEQIVRPTGIVDPAIEVKPVFNKEKNISQVEDAIIEVQKVIKENERVIINVLTKKMAEDLTDYFKKKNFKVKYLHSDIKTIERTKILKEFREGKFDILVGVNLLREGLDLPEVRLVLILDADNEGFLRSETSLIQTMGRAARNVRGRIILYADKITLAIKSALKEIERRRKIQLEYNKKHKIIPQTIKKEIKNLIDLD